MAAGKGCAARALELSAPARDLACGVAAIDAGADSVYIGARAFGARLAAGNPTEEIRRLADYAHRFHARVYAALNTVLYDAELDAARELIHELYAAGADAESKRADVYKTLVYRLARWVNRGGPVIPESSIVKAPCTWPTTAAIRC